MATTAFASGEAMEFLWLPHVRGRLDRLIGLVLEAQPQLPPVAHAIAILFETLVVHPLQDGNGRLARLLFQGSLRRTLGLRSPVFPLGPAFAANRRFLLSAYLAWHLDHEPGPLVHFVQAAIRALGERLDRCGDGGRKLHPPCNEGLSKEDCDARQVP